MSEFSQTPKPKHRNTKSCLQLAALEQAKRESEKAAQDRFTKSEQAASAREEKAKAEEKAKVPPRFRAKRKELALKNGEKSI